MLNRFHLGHYLSVACAALSLALAYAPNTQAQMTNLGPTVNMANLTNGQTIVVGDKAFTDFSISGIQADMINVTPIEQGGDYGIQFGGAIVSFGSPVDLRLAYQVSVTNSMNLISQANLSFNGAVTPPGGSGLAEVVEQIYTNNEIGPYGQMTVYVDGSGNGVLFTNLVITPPQQLLNVDKDVLVDATLPAESSISYIDQTFAQVPEPTTGAMVVLGAVTVLGGCRLRRRPS